MPLVRSARRNAKRQETLPGNLSISPRFARGEQLKLLSKQLTTCLTSCGHFKKFKNDPSMCLRVSVTQQDAQCNPNRVSRSAVWLADEFVHLFLNKRNTEAKRCFSHGKGPRATDSTWTVAFLNSISFITSKSAETPVVLETG